MAGIAPALTPAGGPGGWLADDSRANAGSGTTPYTREDANPAAPQVPTRDNPLPVEVPEVEDSEGLLYQPPGWTGAWPTFTQGDWRRGPVVRPVGSAHGDPDPYAQPNSLGRAAYDETTNHYTNLNQYAGFDAHSQQVDSKGWRLNTPTGRTAEGLRRGDASRGFRFFWPPTAERPTPVRLARRAAPNNSPNGTPGVLNGAALPTYSSLAMGGPGNIAYEAPAPPPTVQAPPDTAAPDWTWGSF